MSRVTLRVLILLLVAFLSLGKCQDNLEAHLVARLPRAIYGLSAAYDQESSIFLVGGYSHNDKGASKAILKFNVETMVISKVGEFP